MNTDLLDIDIYTENGGVIKNKWNEEFIKNGGICKKRGLFNKGLSDALDEWK